MGSVTTSSYEKLVMQKSRRQPQSNVTIRRFRQRKSCFHIIAIPQADITAPTLIVMQGFQAKKRLLCAFPSPFVSTASMLRILLFHAFVTQVQIELRCNGWKANALTTRLRRSQQCMIKMPYLNQGFQAKKKISPCISFPASEYCIYTSYASIPCVRNPSANWTRLRWLEGERLNHYTMSIAGMQCQNAVFKPNVCKKGNRGLCLIAVACVTFKWLASTVMNSSRLSSHAKLMHVPLPFSYTFGLNHRWALIR